MSESKTGTGPFAHVISVIHTIGKDVVAVVGTIGSVLAAVGGVIPAELALYIVSGLAVARAVGEDLENA